MSATDLDRLFIGICRKLPPKYQTLALRLPRIISCDIIKEKGWNAFVLNPTLFDLPLYIFDDTTTEGRAKLALFIDRYSVFRGIHHLGCIYALLLDRIADGQSASNGQGEELAGAFRRAWVKGLADALDESAADIDGSIEDAVDMHRKGVRIGRRAMSKKAMNSDEYVRSNGMKLRVYLVSTLFLMNALGMNGKRTSLINGFNCFMIAGQCIDDARDVNEDRVLFGSDFCSMLGYPPQSMTQTGLLLAAEAAWYCHEAGFPKLGKAMLSTKDALIVPGTSLMDDLYRMGGLALSIELYGKCMTDFVEVHHSRA